MERQMRDSEVVIAVKSICAFILDGISLKAEQSGVPQEKLKERQMKAKKVCQQKVLQEINPIEKQNKSLKNICENFYLNLQNMQEQLRNSVYEEQRSTIKGQVMWREENYLFIDILSEDINPKYLDCALTAIDKKVQIRHHWKKHHSYPNLWEGAVAVFHSTFDCKKATKTLKQIRSLNVMHMKDVLEALIDAEIHCTTCKLMSTGLTIKGNKSLPRGKQDQILSALRRYGHVSEIKFKPDICAGEICRVWYRCASHALLAKLILDQSTIFDIEISVEVIASRMESHIYGLMRNKLRCK